MKVSTLSAIMASTALLPAHGGRYLPLQQSLHLAGAAHVGRRSTLAHVGESAARLTATFSSTWPSFLPASVSIPEWNGPLTLSSSACLAPPRP